MSHLTELLISFAGSLQICQPYGLWGGRGRIGSGGRWPGYRKMPAGVRDLAPFRDAFGFQTRSGGVAGARPPATFWQPSGLAKGMHTGGKMWAAGCRSATRKPGPVLISGFCRPLPRGGRAGAGSGNSACICDRCRTDRARSVRFYAVSPTVHRGAGLLKRATAS